MFNTGAEFSARSPAPDHRNTVPPFPFPASGCARSRMRRVADIAVSSAILLFTLPLLLLVALAIKCEGAGRVLERTERTVSGHRFMLLTFRTTAYNPEFFAPEWARTTTQVG